MSRIPQPQSSQEAIRTALSLRDGLGREIDSEIVLPVAAMLRNGVQTHSSCEGHRDYGLPYPWVHYSAENQKLVKEMIAIQPLPGWETVFLGEYYRLMPAYGLIQNEQHRTLTLAVMDEEAYLSMGYPHPHLPEKRRELLEKLSDYQIQINQWGQQVLVV